MEERLLKRARNLIAERIGLLVREQDDALLRKGLAARLQALGFSSGEQYCQFLNSDADFRDEREALAVLLTTGETYFFRDGGQYALLHDRLLPELLGRRKVKRELRIWCAACASGEEPYSLAIVLDELLGREAPWNILLLGTDINHHAIEKARRGIYTEWSFRGMSDERRQRYFHRHKDAWALDERIRNMVTFRTGDLVADAFPDQACKLHDMDLILCRNTFIYMAPAVVSRIADKLTETLVDGGMLMTGHSELYSHHLGRLRARVFPESIVYQKVAGPFGAPIPELHAEAAPAIRTKRVATAISAQPQLVAPPAPAQQALHEEGAGQEAVPQMQQAWRNANQGHREMAEQSCREMIARNPLDAEPHYLLALLAQEQGEFAHAKDLLKKAIYLDPSFIAAYLDLGDLYAREGDAARAGKMRSTALELLKALPGEAPVRLYGAATVDAVLQYVGHMLNIDKQ